MSVYSNFVLTNKGVALLSDIINGNGILEFRYLATGSGEYAAEDKETASLRELEALKKERQQTAFAYIGKTEEGLVNLKADVTNNDLTAGYYLTEVGIYAGKSGEEESILYCVSTATEADYMPDFLKEIPYNVVFDVRIGIGDVEKVTIAYQPDTYALAADFKAHTDDIDNPHQVTKAQVGLKYADNTADMDKPVSTAQQEAIDAAYQQATAYADNQISQLINGAPSTLDTLKEIADAIAQNEDVVEALDQAVGSKAAQEELDGHTGNNTIHITASERNAWNGKMDTDGDSSNTTVAFEQASTRTAINSGEKLAVLFGKIEKWLSDLKTVAFSGSYNDLSDRPSIPTKTSDLTNDSGYKTTDNNTTYALSKTGSTITLTGSDGSKTSVTDSDTNTVYTHPSYPARTGVPTANQTPTFGGTFSVTQPVSDSTGHITGMNSRTVKIPNTLATTSADGLMSAADKKAINDLSNNYAAKSHTHNYLPLSGGIMTGDIGMQNSKNIYPMTANQGFVGTTSNYFNAGAFQRFFTDVIAILGDKGNTAISICSATLQARNSDNSAWVPCYASAFTQQSSRRYKEHIIDLPPEKVDQLMQYRVVNYDYTNKADGVDCMGMIAEEVAAVNSYPVVYDSDGNPDGLDYSKFVPQLIAFCQKLQGEIVELNTRIDQLEGNTTIE